MPVVAIVGGVAGCASGVGLLFFGRRSTRFLGKDEQLVVQRFTETEVINGPKAKFLMPFTYRSAEVRKAETLGMIDYVKVIDSVQGSERIERGPKLLFLGAYENIEYENEAAKAKKEKKQGISVSATEYVLVQDKLKGTESVVRGPTVWYPQPQEVGKAVSALSLSSTEYVLVIDKQTGEKHVEKGPKVWFPAPMQTGQKAAGISLGSTEYVIVENSLSGERRVDRGPCVWFPGPQENGKKYPAISLSATQYTIVEDRQTGEKRTVKGPRVWFPEPYETASDVMEAVALQADEYIRLKDMATGKRWVQKGKTLVFLEPTWQAEVTGAEKGREAHGVRKAWVLKKYEYVRLLDSVTGTITTHKGEATVFPTADEVALDDGKKAAVDLKVNEYAKVLDQGTGDIRVVGGPDQVFLGPHEMLLDGGKKKAVEVDDEHAALVRCKKTGQIRLVTEKQLFVPGPHESIEEIRDLIRLDEHQAMIIKDAEGNFRYFYGSAGKAGGEERRSFFLPPYATIVKLCWSRGRRREKRDLYIQVFDCRAQYMSFEFNCRTKDNVELVLEGTFFWEVIDLPRMVRTTGDTSGDICNHARSQFIKHVARVTLKEFMDDLNSISNKVYADDNDFYESRGVKVHSLEVTGYQCAEETTSAVLQQIIQETTNRMNRLSQQESENEVKIFKMQGTIEQEQLNGKLLAIQHEHSEKEAQVQGKAEADRVSAFITGLAKDVPKLEDRITMWQTLRKTEALSVISEGKANLYFTPNDVNLSIEAKSA